VLAAAAVDAAGADAAGADIGVALDATGVEADVAVDAVGGAGVTARGSGSEARCGLPRTMARGFAPSRAPPVSTSAIARASIACLFAW
jgi:hypothetical protein